MQIYRKANCEFANQFQEDVFFIFTFIYFIFFLLHRNKEIILVEVSWVKQEVLYLGNSFPLSASLVPRPRLQTRF